MSENYTNRPPSNTKSPYTVDSTNSSVLDDRSFNCLPNVNGSTVNNNGNNQYLTETLRSYINALKFDTNIKQEEPLPEKDSSLLVEQFLGRNKNSGEYKRAKTGNAQNGTKSRVTFSPASETKSSAAYLAPSSSSKVQASRDPRKREKTKSSTSTVIRDWGKRPMLVDTEAPWTPRNRMYQNALKAVARTQQFTENGFANNNNPAFYPQQLANLRSVPPPNTAVRYPPGPTTGNIPIFVQPGSNLPQAYPLSSLGYQQQQPVLTGISPLPANLSTGPLAVALQPPPGSAPAYAYPQQPGTVLPAPQQQPQTVVYGQINSQGMWVPILEPIRQQRQPGL